MTKKEVEYRVRSVERRIVTRFERASGPNEGSVGSSIVAELQQAAMAETVAAALAEREGATLVIEPRMSQPTQFAIVQKGFEPETRVFFAYTQGEADQVKADCERSFGAEFEIFSR